ncbi:MAG TPA: hypothetical protein VFT65_15385 [Candidatus Angelobacter sp.]|nr:hypothetical protein [Candidatus Angelobacter sp.]
MMRRIRALVLIGTVLSATMFGFYQKRQPTPVQEKVIAKYAAVVNKVLDQVRGEDWEETVDSNINHPMVNVMDDRPMDIDQVIQRTYVVKPGSKRYKTLIAPMVRKMEAETDPTRKQLLGAKIEDLKHLQVQVHCNMRVVSMITGPNAKIDPKIPGATFVHQDRNNPFSHGVAYVLFFSNGKAGRWEEVNDVYRNFFIHQPNTPFIENLEVRIFGSEDRIKELLHKVDWKQLNSALTQ